MKLSKIILKIFKKSAFLIVLYFLLSIIINYAVTYIPIVIQYFIDSVIGHKSNNQFLGQIFDSFNGNLNLIAFICISLAILQIVIVLCKYIRNVLRVRIVESARNQLKIEVIKHIQLLQFNEYHNSSIASYIQNSSDDVKNIIDLFDRQLTYIFDIALILIFAFINIVNLNAYLSLVLLFSILLIVLFSFIYIKGAKKKTKELMKIQKELYSKTTDNYSNAKFFKINNLQEEEYKKFEQINQKYYDLSAEKTAFDSKYKLFVSSFLNRMQVPLIFILGFILYYYDIITVGAIYVTISYANKIINALNNMAELMEFINSYFVSYGRLQEIFNAKIENSGTIPFNKDNFDIKFENVTIKLNNTTILKNLNFEIKSNEKVAIIGPTGSGKTILLKTLTGFYDYSGSIKIGGIELKELNKMSLRENMCLILQESYLFSKSITDNITLLNNKADVGSILEFFKIKQEVQAFINQENTLIGGNGATVSKGQKQRIVLARAFAEPKNIMLFDDSFSAIDIKNKNEILENLLKQDDYTQIFVTHNIEIAPKCNKVLFLDNKKAVCSTHNILLSNEKYKQLVNLSSDNLGDDYA